MPGEVAALAKACEHLEKLLALAPGTLRIELMIETTQSVINERGEANLLPLVDAARGRCAGAHFGVYDYTAACGITAAHQHMLHPVCDFAREVMQVALAGTGVQLSDGATNVLPVPVHRASGWRGAHGAADCGESRGGSCGVEIALWGCAAFARQRLLSGMGFASRAAADALCGGVFVFSRKPGARLRRGCAR